MFDGAPLARIWLLQQRKPHNYSVCIGWYVAHFFSGSEWNPSVMVQYSPHALLRARERGATLQEIESVLASGDPVPAKRGRSCMRKLFPVDEVRQGRRYSQKTVEVYHVVEGDVIVVVTVYVFFGGRES
jgi:hypothetical protein